MKDEKKKLIREVADKLNRISEKDQAYALGVMQGIVISRTTTDESEKKT
jgi:hypothetical protein